LLECRFTGQHGEHVMSEIRAKTKKPRKSWTHEAFDGSGGASGR